MKCNICDKEKEKLHKFYWGFFKSEYEPDKWLMACESCQLRFLKASGVYCANRTPLIEMEKEIKTKVRKRNVKY